MTNLNCHGVKILLSFDETGTKLILIEDNVC